MGQSDTHNVAELTNRHLGDDIYIVGSGKSVDFLHPNFFVNRMVIGVNHTYQKFVCSYVVCHHHEICQYIIDTGNRLVTSVHDMCIIGKESKPLNGFFYTYNHHAQGFCHIDTSYLDKDDCLVAGGTIVTTAISLAYKLGAKAIWLVGCDGGAIDDEINYTGYHDPTNRSHFGNTQPQLREIAKAIRERGVPVLSVNPFIDFGNEGHKFCIV